MFKVTVEKSNFKKQSHSPEEKRLFRMENLEVAGKRKIAFIVYLRKGGRVTVPKEVRDSLVIEDGDLIECEIWKVK